MARTANESSAPPRAVSRNAVTQVAGRILYLLTRVGLPPLVLRHVSPEEYGIWATCFLIIGYIGVGAFGVSNVYIRFVAEYTATRRESEIGRLIATGLCLSLAFGVVVFAALWLLMPWVTEGFGIPVELRPRARVLILGTVATMLLDMSFGAFAYVLTGLHRIVEQTLVWILSVVLETLLIVFLLIRGAGVEGMLLAFIARYLFATVLYAIVMYRVLPGLRLRLGGPGESPLRLFLSYGGIMQLTGLIGIFLYSCERIIGGMVSGVIAVGVLDIGQKFPMMASQVFSSASSSILVGLTHLNATGDRAGVIHLYRRSSRYIHLLNGCAMGYMAAFATPLVTAWIGVNPAYDQAGRILLLAALGYHANALTGPANVYCQSINRPGLAITRFQLPQLLLLALGLGLILSRGGGGLLDIVWVAAVARILCSLAFVFQANRRMGFSQWSYGRRVLLPGLMPYAVGLALAALATPGWLEAADLPRLTLVLRLTILLALYGLSVLILLAGLLESDERQQLRGVLRRLAGSRRPA